MNLAACFGIVLVILLVFTLLWVFHPGGRKQAEKDYFQLTGEMGFRPLTPAERQAEEAESRKAYNNATRAGTFWAGGDSYIDYDGYIIDMNTGKPTGQTKPPKNR